MSLNPIFLFCLENANINLGFYRICVEVILMILNWNCRVYFITLNLTRIHYFHITHAIYDFDEPSILQNV